MVLKSQLLNNLSSYLGNAKILKYDQVTSDIINEIVKRHNVDASEYDKIYKFFWNGNLESSAKNIFDFIKKNIRYNIESGSKQTLKTPNAILITGKADCKQYSQFIAGILDAIKRNENVNFEWCYRFASYNSQKAIQHVFVIIKLENKEIWIDPVLPTFNLKKEYTYKLDKKPMALYQISGVQKVRKTILGKALKKVSKPIAQASKTVAKTVTKGAKGVAKVAKPISKVLIKVGTTPARNAFLLLVRLNVLQLATKMGSKLSKIEPQLSKVWKGLGGNYNTLKSTIIKGSKNKIGCSPYSMYNPNTVGAEPVSVTAIALATPIIIKVGNILKAVGIDPNELIKAGRDVLISKSEQVINDNLPSGLAETIITAIDKSTGRDLSNVNQSGSNDNFNLPNSNNQNEGNFNIPNIEQPDQGNIEIETATKVNPQTGVATIQNTEKSMDFKKLLLPVAGILAVYLIIRKK